MTLAVQEICDRFRMLSKSEKETFFAEIEAELLTSEETSIPQWHMDILAEREQLIRDGKTAYVPWEQAKVEIRAAMNRK